MFLQLIIDILVDSQVITLSITLDQHCASVAFENRAYET